MAEDLLITLVVADRVAEGTPLPHAEPRAVAVTDKVDRRECRPAGSAGRHRDGRNDDEYARCEADQRQTQSGAASRNRRVTNDAAEHVGTDVTCVEASSSVRRLASGERDLDRVAESRRGDLRSVLEGAGAPGGNETRADRRVAEESVHDRRDERG